MRVRALDANGDWTFGRGRGNYLTAKAARAQNLQTRLMSFLGDCFWDLGAGIDWFNLLGGKSALQIDFAVQSTIIGTDGIVGIDRDSIAVDSNRQLSAKYTVTLLDEGSASGVSATQISTTDLLTELGDVLTTEAGDPIGI